MENNEMREFDLGAILNVSSGKLFTNINDVFEVLNYLTGRELVVNDFADLKDIVMSHVLELHPELKGVGTDVVIEEYDDAQKFVNEQKKIFGDKLSLTPLKNEDK